MNKAGYAEVKIIGITTPAVDFIPDSEGIISYAARVSSPDNQLKFETADKLLSYCARNKHWSVFQMVNVVLEIKTTRDIARQLLRHGTNFQEFSGRYAVMQEFVTRECRLQDNKNRQNSVECPDEELANWFEEGQQKIIESARSFYEEALARGVAKEQARAVLPEGNTISRLYANKTVREWIHYCAVRNDPGVAQKEHTDLARKVAEVMIERFPSLREHFTK